MCASTLRGPASQRAKTSGPARIVQAGRYGSLRSTTLGRLAPGGSLPTPRSPVVPLEEMLTVAYAGYEQACTWIRSSVGPSWPAAPPIVSVVRSTLPCTVAT